MVYDLTPTIVLHWEVSGRSGGGSCAYGPVHWFGSRYAGKACVNNSIPP